MKNIVGLGEILWDIFPERKVLGGAPSNFAYHVSQLCGKGIAVSAIGDDELGKQILEELDQRKLKYLIETVDYPTGTVNVTLHDGEPQYEICENVAWDNIPFDSKAEGLAVHSICACFGSLAQRSKVSHNTILQFLDSMSNDSFRIFDINLRQHFYSKDIIDQSLERSNVLKINGDEIKVVMQLFDLDMSNEEACKYLIKKYNLRVVILTDGTKGSYVYTPNKVSFCETPKVAVADTVGAGDSFTAAFTVAYIKGKGITESHKFAVEVSAYVCTQRGAMPKLPEEFSQWVNS